MALLFILTVVPLTELYVLFFVGAKIGFFPTVGFTILTAALGSFLARRQGLRVWSDWKRSLERLESPEHSVVEGLMILVGGVLLLTPGFLTDAVGFLLLLPWTRRLLLVPARRRLATHFTTLRTNRWTSVSGGSGWTSPSSVGVSNKDVVDTTAVDLTNESNDDLPRLR